jgi:ABC-type glycerol-3-phosphate transport system permease component
MQTSTTAQPTRLPRAIRGVNIYRLRRRGGVVLAYATLLALCAVILLPLGWMFRAALTPDDISVFTIPPEWFPTQYWNWDNFTRALSNPLQPFGLYMFNTLVIAVGNIVGTVFSCSLAAYAFARLRFRGSEILFNVLIITMLIPWQVLMIPQFLMFQRIGWYGTFWPLIVPSFTGNAFFIFLIRQYMRTFPRDLDEAARVDGAGYWRIFRSIVLPLSVPALTVAVVFTFLGQWNNLLGPLIYLNDNSQFTVAIGLANFVTTAGTQWNLLMAANLITMIPCIVIYFFAQKQLIGGIASVGLKG